MPVRRPILTVEAHVPHHSVGRASKHEANRLSRHFGPLLVVAITLALLGATSVGSTTAAPGFASDAFSGVWTRTDAPVLEGKVSRTWFWGPQPNTLATYERYLDSPGQQRLVQYFDKGRMEINNPGGDATSPWFVTSGLIDRELISGRIQIGSNSYLNTGAGARVPVAGDPDTAFPTYADLQRIVDRGQPDLTGQFAATVLLPGGTATRADAASDLGARYAHYVSYNGPAGTMVGYNIPSAFWDFMTQPGLIEQSGAEVTADPLFDWIFVLGYPIADPVWAQVKLQGATQWVLIQPFERRVLTYTPSNPAAWRVEMGNIGQHYYRWRYATTPPIDLTGDENFLAMAPGYQWTYGTSDGVDQTWQITGVSTSFSGGSQLLMRREDSSDGRQITYWGLTQAGLDLYGVDTLDEAGKLTNSTVYWPPVHYLPDDEPYIGQSWSTKTTAISMNGPPRLMTFSVQVGAYHVVGTPAGQSRAWRLDMVEWERDDPANPNQTTTTIWFAPSVGIMQWFTDGFTAQLKAATTLAPH